MDWLTKIRNAEKTCIVQDRVRKVHYKFEDGQEMAEEYNMDTDVLIRRGWKRGNNLSKKSQWEVEVGDPEPDTSSFDTIGLKEDESSPYIIKRITNKSLEWRIRNLPYPLEFYSVTVEPQHKSITVRTINKKYFKRITIPELDRVNLLPDKKYVNFTYKFGTLIITYAKPPEVLQMESMVLKEIKNIKTIQDGDMPCKPS